MQGHAIATTETVTVTISQGPITYTWSNYKFSQFSDWVIKFKVRLCIWRYDPPRHPLTPPCPLHPPLPLILPLNTYYY